MKTSFSLLLSLGILFFFACKKDKETEKEPDKEATNTSYATDNAIAEKQFDDLFEVTRDAVSSSQDSNQSSLCAVITLDLSVSPTKLTVDFGVDGCKGPDGKTRKGKIITTISGYYRDSGTVIISTTDNYYVDDFKVEGVKTVTNLGKNSKGNLHYSVEVKDAIITEPGKQWTIEWNSSRNREWIEGESTRLNPFDDVYSITGTASGKNRDKKDFTITITKALRVQWCGSPIFRVLVTEGTLEIVPESKINQVIDYGDGSCNNEGTVTILGNVYKFKY